MLSIVWGALGYLSFSRGVDVATKVAVPDHLAPGGWGDGIYAAAEIFFSKTPKDLTPVEAATLAGLVQAPSTYDPASSDRKAATDRRSEASGQVLVTQPPREMPRDQSDEPSDGGADRDGDRQPAVLPCLGAHILGGSLGGPERGVQGVEELNLDGAEVIEHGGHGDRDPKLGRIVQLGV